MKSRRLIQRVVWTGLQTNHNRIVSFGLLVGLFYLPSWLRVLWDITFKTGSSNLIINAGFIYLGLSQLWHQRRSLAALPTVVEERLTGHVLILGAAIAFALCSGSVSLQALSVALILIGIAYSTWGIDFFSKYSLPVLLLLFSVYPDLGFLAITLWRNLTPADTLENLMSWCGSLGLQMLGQPALAEGPILSILPQLPGRSVLVASGCNGFDMAFSLAGFTLVIGLFLKLSRLRIISLIAISILLALIFNIPRIMLLAIAAVYWGEDSFQFWHGPIGGQLFTMVLFTVYYYIIMGSLPPSEKKRSP